MLAMALRKEELFALDNINWAFIRPAKPTDRPLAYAQAHWMLEYISETHGANAVIDMLKMFGEGAKTYGFMVSPVAVAFGVFIMIIEAFVALLQAYIFTMLSILFVNISVHPEH